MLALPTYSALTWSALKELLVKELELDSTTVWETKLVKTLVAFELVQWASAVSYKGVIVRTYALRDK